MSSDNNLSSENNDDIIVPKHKRQGMVDYLVRKRVADMPDTIRRPASEDDYIMRHSSEEDSIVEVPNWDKGHYILMGAIRYFNIWGGIFAGLIALAFFLKLTFEKITIKDTIIGVFILSVGLLLCCSAISCINEVYQDYPGSSDRNNKVKSIRNQTVFTTIVLFFKMLVLNIFFILKMLSVKGVISLDAILVYSNGVVDVQNSQIGLLTSIISIFFIVILANMTILHLRASALKDAE